MRLGNTRPIIRPISVLPRRLRLIHNHRKTVSKTIALALAVSVTRCLGQVINRHKLDRLRLQNTRTVQLAPIEQHLGKTEIIPSRTHQPAATGLPCIAPRIAPKATRLQIALIVLPVHRSQTVTLFLRHIKTRINHL